MNRRYYLLSKNLCECLVLTAIAGCVLLAGTRPMAAAEKKSGDRADTAAKDDDAPPKVRPDDSVGPGGPPSKDDTSRPRLPRRDGRAGGPDWRRVGPGPMAGRAGAEGPARWPGMFGPGPQPGGPPRWPQGDQAGMEKNDSEMFKLTKAENEAEQQTRELSLKYRHASKDDREKIKQDLEKAVVRHFEARQQRRALELKRLEEELKRLRDGMDRREKTRQEIIEKRVSELLGVEPEAGF